MPFNYGMDRATGKVIAKTVSRLAVTSELPTHSARLGPGLWMEVFDVSAELGCITGRQFELALANHDVNLAGQHHVYLGGVGGKVPGCLAWWQAVMHDFHQCIGAHERQRAAGQSARAGP